MNNQFTQEEQITVKVNIWAIPHDYWTASTYRGVHGLEADAIIPPFYYEVRMENQHCYAEGAVKITEEPIPVDVTVPGGVDLFAAAIQTLEAAKEEARDEYNRKTQKLDKEIRKLRMLAGPTPSPTPGNVYEHTPGE